ncbi:predicted protein [Nematostella vectensis]|uniref:Uncharacterized protein n=1 Tax=Nematostella vectensis TaxID=45351 RepID=A7SMN0_NEMVE|nr:predicted protein [Nematostella vectensis]|eukprot:XP_001627157.1 predicted protein [Nematostella vectensis]
MKYYPEVLTHSSRAELLDPTAQTRVHVLDALIAKEKEQAKDPFIRRLHRDMITQTQTNEDRMVFPRSEFPRKNSHANHVSPLPFTFRESKGQCTVNMLSDLEPQSHGDHGAFKRPFFDGTNFDIQEKKRRLDSRFPAQEEISQDFETGAIKNCLARKKNRIYNELLLKFGIEPPTDEKIVHFRDNVLLKNVKTVNSRSLEAANEVTAARPSSEPSGEINTVINGYNVVKEEQVRVPSVPFAHCSYVFGKGKAGTYLKESPDDSKVFDDEGNCYIDSHDFDSFYKPKKIHAGKTACVNLNSSGNHVNNGIAAGNNNSKKLPSHIEPILPPIIETSDHGLPKRGLNFTFHGTNGGYAVDHDTMPRIIAIHSIPTHGKQMMRQHAVAELRGSVYKAASATIKEEHCDAEEGYRKTPGTTGSWWPPSPDSIPDETTPREQHGLLKIMTPEDRIACGLDIKETKNHKLNITVKEEVHTDDDDDVIVTKVTKSRHPKNETHTCAKNMADPCPTISTEKLREIYTQQISSDSTGENSENKAFLLYLLSLRAQKSSEGDGKTVPNREQDVPLLQARNAPKQPRKKFNIKELCDKLINTRERLEQEQLAWKRKLLVSLEVVLIKKIRRLERETGESAPEGLVTREEVLQEEGLSDSVTREDVGRSNDNLVNIVEDLTGKKEGNENAKGRERNKSVSEIRGYDSS